MTGPEHDFAPASLSEQPIDTGGRDFVSDERLILPLEGARFHDLAGAEGCRVLRQQALDLLRLEQRAPTVAPPGPVGQKRRPFP